MILEILIIGIILLIVGIINILLGWRCYDAEAMSILITIGGIIFTLIGLFGEGELFVI